MNERKCLEIDVLPVTDEYMQHNYVKNLRYEFIEDIIMFCTIYPLLNILNCVVCSKTSLAYMGLTLLPVMMIMSYMRVKINKRYLFDIGVIIAGALYFAFSMAIPYKNVYGIAGIVCTVVSIWRSKKNQNVKYNINIFIEHEVLLIVFLFIAIIMRNRFIQSMILVCGLIIIVLSLAYLSKARNVRLIKDDSKNETFRNRDSSMFAVQIAVLISVLLVIFQVTGVFAAANRLSNTIVTNLQEAATGDYKNGVPKEAKNLVKNDMPGPDLSKIKPKKTKFNIIIIVLMYALTAVVTVLAAAIVIGLIYLLLNRLMIDIKRLKNSDKVTFVLKENGEGEQKEKAKHESVIKKHIFLSPRDKVRKIYKKKVKSYKKSGAVVKQNWTVNDIEKEILDKTNSNIDYISNMYEKARYSDEEISKEDIEGLKANKDQ